MQLVAVLRGRQCTLVSDKVSEVLVQLIVLRALEGTGEYSQGYWIVLGTLVSDKVSEVLVQLLFVREVLGGLKPTQTNQPQWPQTDEKPTAGRQCSLC